MKHYNQSRMDLYKTAINQCCNPNCNGVLAPLQTHHIEPLRHGGIDTFLNYIVLCRICHGIVRHNKNNVGWDKETLLKWKFYKEILLLGKCSDELSTKEYRRFLRKSIKTRNIYV